MLNLHYQGEVYFVTDVCFLPLISWWDPSACEKRKHASETGYTSSNHTHKHKIYEEIIFYFEGKNHERNSKIYQINYNNSCVCLTAKEKSLLFFLLSHILIISLKDGNSLLSPFYFLLHAQLSLGCLFLSKPLSLAAFSFFLCGFLFLCFLFNMQHTHMLFIHKKASAALDFFFQHYMNS